MKDLYTTQVTVSGGRDGRAVSSDGRLAIQLGFPKELGGNGDAANPEQLFVAGYAACFASSIKAAAAKHSMPVAAIEVDGQGTLSLRDDGSFTISRVLLTVHAGGLGDAASAVIDEAKRICAYSNATRGNVQAEITLA